MIRTVLGDISKDCLGNTQCHEHLYIEKGKSFDINLDLHMDEPVKTISELESYRAAGGKSIVDAQPVYCGRMAGALVDASRRTGVNIIAVTGFHKTIFYNVNDYPYYESEKKITELFVSEVSKGMLDTDGKRLRARAGVIKVAVDSGGIQQDKIYEKLFSAAAKALNITGAPTIVHMEKGADAMEIIRYFNDRGIQSSRIILCHLDRTHYDFDLHREVLSSGVFLCYDSVNRLKYLSHKQEAELILAMLDLGFGSQLLLSLDTTRARLREYGGHMGLDYLNKEFLQKLRELGVSVGDIQNMMSNNAAKALQLIG